jgi:hypothetical protein
MSAASWAKYGHLAMRHWQRTDPDRYRAIPESEREAFFSQLGEQAETEIQQLQDALAGPEPAGRPIWRRWGGSTWPGCRPRSECSGS